MDLCIACASSIPHASGSSSNTLFTPCCNRVICPRCDAVNPRLKSYNPCLSCFGGVAVVTTAPEANRKALKVGHVEADDVFVVGDDGEDGSGDDDGTTGLSEYAEREMLENGPKMETQEAGGAVISAKTTDATSQTPKVGYSQTEYWIKPGDTLVGIALKYGVDGRQLCKLNELPPSTLSVTPHLLHTRTTLTLPPNARRPASPPPPDAQERLERRAKERAAKRLQFVTKEVDFRVAKAYVSLADGSDQDDEFNSKSKLKEVSEDPKRRVRGPGAVSGDGLEERAVDRYLEDEEWEAEQRRLGQKPVIQGFPYFGGGLAGSSGVGPQEKAPSWTSSLKKMLAA